MYLWTNLGAQGGIWSITFRFFADISTLVPCEDREVIRTVHPVYSCAVTDHIYVWSVIAISRTFLAVPLLLAV